MTLEEKKAALYNHFKDDPDKLTTAISEIMFDISSVAQLPKYKDAVDNEEDSRTTWLNFLEWAWEFEYEWEFNDKVDNSDYFGFIDTFMKKKLDETYTLPTFTVSVIRYGTIKVQAEDYWDARDKAADHLDEIVWDRDVDIGDAEEE